jgi:MFS family permease
VATQATNASGTEAAAAAKTAKTISLFIIAGAQLMIVLDATIVNIALPQMGRYFEVSQTTMTWALNAYTLTFGGLLLLGGKAGDLFGRKQMFQLGLGLFAGGSLLSGVAPSFGVMLTGRVIQGIGGAIASPTALSLIVTEFEEGPERTRAFGVFSAVSGGGLVSTAGLFALVYGFIHAASDGWGNGVTIASLVVGVALLTIFVIVESRIVEPMMPLNIFKNRNRTGSYIIMLIVGAGMFGMFYFLTFFVQGVLGYSPLKSGFAFLPVALTIGVSAQIAGKIILKLGPKPLIVGGAILNLVGLLLLSRLNEHSGYWEHVFVPMVIVAFGMGPIFVSVFTVAVSGLTREESGLGSALVNVMQQVGSSLGLSVLATVAGTAARNGASDQLAKLTPEQAQHFGEISKAALTGATPSPAAATDGTAMQAFLHVQAHSASSGFLAAACFAVAAIIAAAVLIKISKAEYLEVAGGDAAPVMA